MTSISFPTVLTVAQITELDAIGFEIGTLADLTPGQRDYRSHSAMTEYGSGVFVLIRAIEPVLFGPDKELEGYYEIVLPNCHANDVGPGPRDPRSDLRLVPIGTGSAARSSTNYSDYAYSNGGRQYQAAVQAAKEIASVLGI